MGTKTFIADGTSRNWSANGSWVEGTAPTAADDVVFLTNLASSILVIDGTSGSPNLCRSIDTTGYTRQITLANAKQLNVGDGTTGAFKMTAGMTFAPGASSVIKFVSTTTGNNITWGGYSYGLITFDGVGGAWQFQDSFATSASSGTITLTNGALDTNGQTVASTNGTLFSSNNSNTRSLTLGASTWKLNDNGTTAWDIGTSTGMTLSAASSTITIVSTVGSETITFAGGGLTYGTVQCSSIASGTTIAITGANTFGTLTMTGSANPGTTVQLAADQVVSGTCTITGNSNVNRTFVSSSVKGTARSLSAGTFTFTRVDLQDITKAGAGSGNISAITGGSGDCGGNTGWTFTTPISAYMKTAVSVNWSAANWFTTSGGSTPITNSIPLPQDTAIFDSASVTAGSKVITIDSSMRRISGMNFTGIANVPTLTFTQACSYFGSMTFVSSSLMTISGTGLMTLEGRGSQTITTAANTLTAGITVNSPGGTWTLSDAMTNNRATSAALTITSGTFATGANNLTLSGSSGAITVNGGTLTSASTISLTGTSAANITISSGDINAASGIISMTGAGSTMTLSGGTLEVGTLTRTGFALTIGGTAVTLGTGGAAFATPLTISSGSLVPSSGNKITSVSSTAIAVSASATAGASLSRVMTGM